jgi:hypothetical protein
MLLSDSQNFGRELRKANISEKRDALESEAALVRNSFTVGAKFCGSWRAAWCLALYSIHLYPLLIIHKLQDKQDIILKLDTHYARRTPRGRRKHSCN